MFSRIKQLDICCDAPPYGVVRACKGCGFHSPLDVRWCRMSHFVAGERQRKGNIGIRLWQWFFGRTKPKPITCSCGQPLPELKEYGFTYSSKAVGDYLMGQCRRCRTVFWDVPLLVPTWMEEGVVRVTIPLEM
jgi:hypothetical protein